MSAATRASAAVLVLMGMLAIVCLADEPQVATENCASDKTLDRIESLVRRMDGDLSLAELRATREALLSPDNKLDPSYRAAQLEVVNVIEHAMYPPDESQSSNQLDQKVPKSERLLAGCSNRVKQLLDLSRANHARHRRQRHRRRLLEANDKLEFTGQYPISDLYEKYLISKNSKLRPASFPRNFEELSDEQMLRILQNNTNELGQELLKLERIRNSRARNNYEYASYYWLMSAILDHCKHYRAKVGSAADAVEQDVLQQLASGQESELESREIIEILVFNHTCKILRSSFDMMTDAQRAEILNPRRSRD